MEHTNTAQATEQTGKSSFPPAVVKHAVANILFCLLVSDVFANGDPKEKDEIVGFLMDSYQEAHEKDPFFEKEKE